MHANAHGYTHWWWWWWWWFGSCEKVWSQMMADESVNSPMVVIQSCLRVHTDQPLLWISREGLQRAVASLQPAAP
jgi:hypothetical protein